MTFRPVTNRARLSVILAAATSNSIANADALIAEASFNSYFSIGLIAAGLVALVIMRRRNLPLE